MYYNGSMNGVSSPAPLGGRSAGDPAPLPLRRPARWRLGQADARRVRELERNLLISPVTARVLCSRGLDAADDARRFLDPHLDHLADPFALPDMDKAVARLLAAVQSHEAVCVWGDYDVDGLAATVLMVDALSGAGARAFAHVPNRLEEGYGLHAADLPALREDGVRLVVCVDCGATAVAEAELAQKLGIELVVCDHHEVSDPLPAALAVVDPKRRDGPWPGTELAGCGVAFKVALALARAAGDGEAEARLWAALGLVALGTVADVVPLLGENRVLVRHGLGRMGGDGRPGLSALLAAAGLAGRPLATSAVAFGLAPRLNAAGRLGFAGAALELLTCRDEGRARDLAARLEDANRQRQGLEEAMAEQACAMAAAHISAGLSPHVLVLAGEGWHEGVLGIVAARLVERFYMPALMIALDGAGGGRGSGRGSGRGVPGFDLYGALAGCAPLLERFGGHAAAAGFTLKAGAVDELRLALNTWAAVRHPEGFEPVISIDAEVSASELDLALVAELERLQPFGAKNPRPVLAWPGAVLVEARPVGRDRAHTQFNFLDPATGRVLRGIAFAHGRDGGGADVAGGSRLPEPGARLDVAFSLAVNEFSGARRLDLRVCGLRLAQAPTTDAATGVCAAAPGASSAGAAANGPGAAGPDCPEWFDARDVADPCAFAAGLAVAAGGVLALVADADAARRLHAGLAGRGGLRVRLAPDPAWGDVPGPGSATQPGAGAADQPDGGAVVVIAGYAATADGAVADGAAAASFAHVVHVWPTLDPRGFWAACRAAAPGGAVHLAYSRRDVERATRAALAGLPDRAALVLLYRALGDATAGGAWEGDAEALWRMAEGAGVGRGAAAVGLQAFAELGLFALRQREARVELQRLPRPPQRLDLDGSAAFRRARLWAERVERFGRLLVAADLAAFRGGLEGLLRGGE